MCLQFNSKNIFLPFFFNLNLLLASNFRENEIRISNRKNIQKKQNSPVRSCAVRFRPNIHKKHIKFHPNYAARRKRNWSEKKKNTKPTPNVFFCFSGCLQLWWFLINVLKRERGTKQDKGHHTMKEEKEKRLQRDRNDKPTNRWKRVREERHQRSERRRTPSPGTSWTKLAI